MTNDLYAHERSVGQRVAVVIDDDAAIRLVLSDVLRQAGFFPVEAADANAALDAVRRHGPALITLDLSLPGQDGISVAAEIRRICPAPIIVISGNQDEIDVIEAMDAGANAFVPKPFRPRELRARVEALMRRQDWDRAAPAVASASVSRPAPSRSPAAAMMEPVAPPVFEAVFEPPRAEPAPVEPAPAAVAEPVLLPPPVITPAVVIEPASIGDSAPVVNPEPTPVFEPEPAAVFVPEPEPATTTAEWPPVETTAEQPYVPLRPVEGWEDFRGLAVNRTHRLVEVNGESVAVEGVHFDALCAILSTGRNLRSRVDLVGVMFGRYGADVTDADRRSVDVEMGVLLDVLGESRLTPRWIEMIPGVGYRRMAL